MNPRHDPANPCGCEAATAADPAAADDKRSSGERRRGMPAHPGAAPLPRPGAAPGGHRVRLVDADAALRGLLDEWLAALGCTIVGEAADADADAVPVRVDLVIVDVPFPRQGGTELVRRIALQHPGAPILALSPNFFSGIECCGPVARALGVDCVLPKPATREALAAAVRLVLPL